MELQKNTDEYCNLSMKSIDNTHSKDYDSITN